jgi:Uma2 family endonuclease
MLELYAFFADVPITATGSTTFRKEARERGAEPDESYSVERDIEEGQFPDLVIEVIERKPILDKLAVYDGFEIPEVWLLERSKLSVYRRKAKGGYSRSARSAFFPKLDLRALERFAARSDQDAALREFADLVMKKPKKKRR